MFTVDPLSEARETGRQLRAEAAAERLRPPTARRVLAEVLRRTADRLDPAPTVVSLTVCQR